jgi:hypothetical protein
MPDTLTRESKSECFGPWFFIRAGLAESAKMFGKPVRAELVRNSRWKRR